MAFKKSSIQATAYDSPEALFRDLRSRTVEGLLSHQADILRKYQLEAIDEDNVAIELPTGSGKTLVGLLIAEFRRIVRKERVLYLCPTRQLVRQVVEQSERKYGIKATAFVGQVKDFSPTQKAQYLTGATIAVATYSALFNTNPFFESSQLIVLDDAHASENYIASTWSLQISRFTNAALYSGLVDLFRAVLPRRQHQRFTSVNPDLSKWVELIPTSWILQNQTAVCSLIDAHVGGNQLQYPWSLIHDHLAGCQVYVSYNSILIRPFIPPSMTHPAFAIARQRLFMSATLGKGGDLERMTGVKKFHRIPIPAGWDRQGLGRRFFVFPELSLDAKAVPNALLEFLQLTPRSLMIVPSDEEAEDVKEVFREKSGKSVLSAKDIEDSKDSFTKNANAVLVLANRYDGIDLLQDDCRLLIIKGLPRTGNLQEQFLITRMACGIVLGDRSRTRIVQAVGRCTRSATDYSAVCVIGEDFFDWVLFSEKRALFHPEMQGELKFGVDQSQGVSIGDMIENLRVFLAHGAEWNEVDAEIRSFRNACSQAALPGEAKLSASALKEVDFQYAIWNGDFERAFQAASEATGLLAGDEVKGFRGMWYYFSGIAAHLTWNQLASEVHKQKAADMFARASSCLPEVGWLKQLANDHRVSSESAKLLPSVDDTLLACNVEQIEAVFDARGYVSSSKFERDAKIVLDGCASKDSKKFEEAHRLIGELLGFQSENSEEEAAPDPWWISNGEMCIVAEDKSDSDSDSSVPVRHARQVASHEFWIRKHCALADNATITTVMITTQESVHREVPTFTGNVFWWHIDDFRKWVQHAVNVLRRARTTFSGPGNVEWRNATAAILRSEHLDPISIVSKVKEHRLSDRPIEG